MKIKFKSKFKQQELVLVHGLCFKPNGLKKSILLEVDEPNEGTIKEKTEYIAAQD